MDAPLAWSPRAAVVVPQQGLYPNGDYPSLSLRDQGHEGQMITRLNGFEPRTQRSRSLRWNCPRTKGVRLRLFWILSQSAVDKT
jgi:hypothetical protein